MSGHFTDRDERMWQQRAEERAARPVPIGAWLRALRSFFQRADHQDLMREHGVQIHSWGGAGSPKDAQITG
ncbi:hypothetical protein OG462_06000 [Streptomyces sp. NBC_01077]|uniref:hypothetical protein n=1 Tax=Streptomyces sp. NBC_01077 TaxID=2903746 RepID=UPI003869F1C2|nr:hypothetical protein OG462_06000 [Streptomyces sp. NBC_01077]